MTTITLTIPNPVTARVLDGFASHYGYKTILMDGSPNPETKGQFAKRKLLEIIKEAVRAAEIETARNAAAELAATSVDTDIELS